MRIALIGSVSSSWHALNALIESGVDVACVCGVDESRAAKVGDYRPLRRLANNANIPFLSFAKVSEPEVEAFLRKHKPDMLWVIGLSQLVPDRLISIASSGGVGFHPTMLPEGRGRAPVAWTILLGMRAAANLFYLTDEPDAGDIIVQKEVPVLNDDYSEDLIQRTNEVLAEAIKELAPCLKSGNLPRIPQDHSKATFYEKRTPADGLIDWVATTDAIYRLIRAAGRPYHGAFSYVDKHKLIIWRAKPLAPDEGPPPASKRSVKPGTVLEGKMEDDLIVKTADGAMRLTECQLETVDTTPPAQLLTPGKRLGA